MYVTTHDPVRSQKLNLNEYRSLNLNFSSSAKVAFSEFGFFFSAYLSRATKPIAFINENTQMRNPIKSANPKP